MSTKIKFEYRFDVLLLNTVYLIEVNICYCSNICVEFPCLQGKTIAFCGCVLDQSKAILCTALHPHLPYADRHGFDPLMCFLSQTLSFVCIEA